MSSKTYEQKVARLVQEATGTKPMKRPCDVCRGVGWDVRLDGSVCPCPYCGHIGGPRLPPDFNHGAGYVFPAKRDLT